MELEDNLPLLEWLANNYKNFGAGLEIITDRLVIIQFLWMGEVPALRSREPPYFAGAGDRNFKKLLRTIINKKYFFMGKKYV